MHVQARSMKFPPLSPLMHVQATFKNRNVVARFEMTRKVFGKWVAEGSGGDAVSHTGGGLPASSTSTAKEGVPGGAQRQPEGLPKCRPTHHLTWSAPR